MEQQQKSEEARQARLQEMPPQAAPSPAPSPAVVHAEPIDDWTHKPFFTTTVHTGEHEFSLSRNEDADLVVRVFNTNSGDRFERVVAGEEGVAQLVPPNMPTGVKTLDGFAQFLQLALKREAGSLDPGEAAQISCESRETREVYTVELALVMGTGIFATHYPVNLQIPLKNRATSSDKHLIALRTLSDKFTNQIEAQEDKFMGEIAGLQSQLELMKLQMNQRVFFGVNHSVHIACTKLMMGYPLDLTIKTVGTTGFIGDDCKGHSRSIDGNKAWHLDATKCTCNNSCNCDYQRLALKGPQALHFELIDVASAADVASTLAKTIFASKSEFIMPLPAPLLEPLQLCRELVSFEVPKRHGEQITDIEFLRGLPKLEELLLHKPKIKDLVVLASLSNLKHLAITELTLDGGGEIDVTPLASLTTLETINFQDSPAVANVAPLAKILTLKTLNVTNTRVTDRRALAGCEGLTVIPE